MKPHLIALAVLLSLGGAVQWWTLRHAIVPAQDAVRYVALARSMESLGLTTAIGEEAEHPLYPVLIWWTHTVWAWAAGESPMRWVQSAQFVSCLMLLLTMATLYALLLNWQRSGQADEFSGISCSPQFVAVAGVFFFCLLPETARLGADALAESTQLLFLTAAFWAIACHWNDRAAQEMPGRMDDGGIKPGHDAIGLQRHGKPQPPATRDMPPRRFPGWLFLGGLCAGVAMLARPESLVIVPAVGLSLLLFCRHADGRRYSSPRRSAEGDRQPTAPTSVHANTHATGAGSRFRAARALALEAAFGFAGIALAIAPYLAATGAVTPTAAFARLLGRGEVAATEDSGDVRAAAASSSKAWRLPDGERMSFTLKDRSVSSRQHGFLAAGREFVEELPEAFHYWVGGLAVLGIWATRKQIRSRFDGFAQVFCLLFAAAVLYLSARLGYLSTRHLLPIVLLGLAPAALGAAYLGHGINCWLTSRGRGQPWSSIAPAAIVIISGLACLPRTLMPLHASHTGHRQAGDWLAGPTAVAGCVLDSRGWTGLYSGRPTFRYDLAKTAFRNPELAYVIVEQRELDYDSSRSRTLKHLLGGAGEPVATFYSPSKRRADTVLVYRWHPERMTKKLRTGAVNQKTKA